MPARISRSPIAEKPFGRRGPGRDPFAILKSRKDVHARRVAQNLHAIAKVPLERFHQRRAPSRIHSPHPPNVALQMSFGDEIGQCGLLRGGGMPIGQPLGSTQARGQIGRRDHVADPQGRKHHLRKCSDVHHCHAIRQALQRRQRRPAEAIFAVVVVLHDHGVLPARPFDQFQAAHQRHRHAGWKLVRGRNVDEARLGGQSAWDDPAGVDCCRM